MLLRASSKATEKTVSLSCAIGEPIATDIEHGELLLNFTESDNYHSPNIQNLTEEIILFSLLIKRVWLFYFRNFL